MPRKARSSVSQKRKYYYNKKKLNKDDSTFEIQPHVLDHCYSAPSELEEADSDSVSSEFEEMESDDQSEDIPSTEHVAKTGSKDSDKAIIVPISDQIIEIETELSPLQLLGKEIKENCFLYEKYAISVGFHHIRLMDMYCDSEIKTSVKLLVSINSNFDASLFVHRKEVTKKHPCWKGMPSLFSTAMSLEILMKKLDIYSVCYGNPDEEIQNITPVNSGIYLRGNSKDIIAYREENFCARKGNASYSSTIRAVDCTLLVNGNRCRPCQDVRRIVRQRKLRSDEKEETPTTKNYVHSTTPHAIMGRKSLLAKLTQQKKEIDTLSSELEKLKRMYERTCKTDKS
jgi:hypothetical protein